MNSDFDKFGENPEAMSDDDDGMMSPETGPAEHDPEADAAMQDALRDAARDTERHSGPDSDFDADTDAEQDVHNFEPQQTGQSNLAARVAELEEDVARAKDQALRALAEAENARKRAVRDREDAGKYAISTFARDLLDFADNFRRALESFPAELKEEDNRIAGVISGIEAMDKELQNTFEKHGIKKLDPQDQVFDPNFHEVMFEAPGTGQPAGTVIQVIEPGYMINDRLLRPARVGVAKDEGQGNGPTSTGKPGSQVDTQA